MIVEEFNTERGIYIFKLDDFETEFHSHPTVEIIVAEQGTFNLWTEIAAHQNLRFVVIEANKKHKLSAINCKLKIIMIEHHNKFVRNILSLNNIHIDNGFYLQTTKNDNENGINQIVHHIKDEELGIEYDKRISVAINYLDNNELEYGLIMEALQKVTNLSESRLSHLFKANIGISLRKYLIWNKLKSTIKQHLHNSDDLFSSLINNGFYDQPHFSKNFKALLGVKPSKAYNSRNIQVLPIVAL